MAKLIVTDEIAQQVISQYKELGVAGPVADKFNISRSTVYRVLDNAGVAREGLHAHYDRVRKLPDKDSLKIEYESGASMNQLAKKYGCALGSVRDSLNASGAKKRNRGNSLKILTEKEKDTIVRLYIEHGSQDKVARHLKISQPVISRTLINRGIESGKPIGKNHPGWKGGKVAVGDYLAQWVPIGDQFRSMAHSTGYILEHRLVMARHLGRPLDRHETVHHINGDPKDNRIENLQLRQGKHGKGTAHRCKDCGSMNIESTKLKGH